MEARLRGSIYTEHRAGAHFTLCMVSALPSGLLPKPVTISPTYGSRAPKSWVTAKHGVERLRRATEMTHALRHSEPPQQVSAPRRSRCPPQQSRHGRQRAEGAHRSTGCPARKLKVSVSYCYTIVSGAMRELQPSVGTCSPVAVPPLCWRGGLRWRSPAARRLRKGQCMNVVRTVCPATYHCSGMSA
jgi:hypothetical protein